MFIAMAMMSLGSFMVAVVPTYASIGIWAAVLLTIARMVQGISVGGEYGSVATYMSEMALPGKRGFYSSFQYVTLIGGQLLGLVVLGILQQFLSDDQLRAWGWRIPFAIGGFAAIGAAIVRSRLQETTTAEVRKNKDAGSLIAMLTKHWKPAAVVAGFTAGGSLAYYTYATYMQTYLINTAKLPAKTVTYVMTAALFVFMCVQPLFGALSDRIGRRNSMRMFALLTGVATIPILTYMASVPSAVMAFVMATLSLLIISFYTSISGLVKAELFPAELRAMGVGFPYAVANALIGGTAAGVALKFKQMGHEPWFYYYVTAWMVITLLVTLGMPDARKAGYLQGTSEVN
jgi:MFS family permease